MQDEPQTLSAGAQAPQFGDLLERAYSSLIVLPFIIAAVWYGGVVLTILLAAVGLVMAREWMTLLQSTSPWRDAVILGFLTLAALVFGILQTSVDALALVFVSALMVAAVQLWRGDRLAPIVGGLLYVAWPLVIVQWFRAGELGVLIIFYILLTVWGIDIFAMFSGKIIGGPKLARRLSPNKTWVGLAGAVVGAVGVAVFSYVVLVDLNFFAAANFIPMLLLGVVLALVAQISDLFESGLKRKYDLKDSGSILPGHGGLLDRVDGLIGVLHVLFILVLLRGGYAPQSIWMWW